MKATRPADKAREEARAHLILGFVLSYDGPAEMILLKDRFGLFETTALKPHVSRMMTPDDFGP